MASLVGLPLEIRNKIADYFQSENKYDFISQDRANLASTCGKLRDTPYFNLGRFKTYIAELWKTSHREIYEWEYGTLPSIEVEKGMVKRIKDRYRWQHVTVHEGYMKGSYDIVYGIIFHVSLKDILRGYFMEPSIFTPKSYFREEEGENLTIDPTGSFIHKSVRKIKIPSRQRNLWLIDKYTEMVTMFDSKKSNLAKSQAACVDTKGTTALCVAYGLLPCQALPHDVLFNLFLRELRRLMCEPSLPLEGQWPPPLDNHPPTKTTTTITDV